MYTCAWHYEELACKLGRTERYETPLVFLSLIEQTAKTFKSFLLLFYFVFFYVCFLLPN